MGWDAHGLGRFGEHVWWWVSMCECVCVCVCECLRDGLCECACGCGACVREMSVCKTDGRRRCAVGVFGERCDGRLASPQGGHGGRLVEAAGASAGGWRCGCNAECGEMSCQSAARRLAGWTSGRGVVVGGISDATLWGVGRGAWRCAGPCCVTCCVPLRLWISCVVDVCIVWRYLRVRRRE